MRPRCITTTAFVKRRGPESFSANTWSKASDKAAFTGATMVGVALDDEAGTWRSPTSFCEQRPPNAPVVDATTVDEAGKAGAPPPPLPIHFVPYQAASGAELGFDCLVVELGGVQADRKS